MRVDSNWNCQTTAMALPRVPGNGAVSRGGRERGDRSRARCRRYSRGHAKIRTRFRRHFSPRAWSTDMPTRPPHWRPSATALQIAQESGNRFDESHTAVVLSQLEVRHGAPQSALDHLALAIRNYQDSGNIATSRSPLAILAALLYRLRHYESAAISQSSPPTRWLTRLSRRSAKPSPPAKGSRRRRLRIIRRAEANP